MSSEATLQEGAVSAGVPFQYVATGDDTGPAGASEESIWNPQKAAAQGEAEKRVQAGYARGLLEGATRAQANFEASLASFQESTRKAIEDFRNERDAYFNRVEPEVVQLALAIARKILHRESQIDPLLLTGLVHVALEKLDAGTRVRLKVNPSDTHFWNEFFARSPSATQLELSGDPVLRQGECLLETEIGSTQISLETQLKEIEQGFFDLLDQRPTVR